MNSGSYFVGIGRVQSLQRIISPTGFQDLSQLNINGTASRLFRFTASRAAGCLTYDRDPTQRAAALLGARTPFKFHRSLLHSVGICLDRGIHRRVMNGRWEYSRVGRRKKKVGETAKESQSR